MLVVHLGKGMFVSIRKVSTITGSSALISASVSARGLAQMQWENSFLVFLSRIFNKPAHVFLLIQVQLGS